MNKPFFIAEIAQAHDGNIDIAHDYIDAIAKTGVNAVKFQTHIADAESSIHEPFRIKFNNIDATRFDYWKRMEFRLDEWIELKKHCNELGLEFISSPFSNAAVDLLEQVNVKRYKVGSGEITNLLLLERLALTKKPITLSSGMSSFKELDEAVKFLKSRDIDLSILQCTTSYPTQPKNYGFNIIKELKDRYQIPVGFSDHSGKIETSIAAAALGAEIFEFHVVFDRNSNGPDASSSIEISEIKTLTCAVNNIYQSLQYPVDKDDISDYSKLKSIFEKSLAVNKNLKEGHIIAFEDLEAKKPADFGISATFFRSVIGKKLKRNLFQWEFLKQEDII